VLPAVLCLGGLPASLLHLPLSLWCLHTVFAVACASVLTHCLGGGCTFLCSTISLYSFCQSRSGNACLTSPTLEEEPALCLHYTHLLLLPSCLLHTYTLFPLFTLQNCILHFGRRRNSLFLRV